MQRPPAEEVHAAVCSNDGHRGDLRLLVGAVLGLFGACTGGTIQGSGERDAGDSAVDAVGPSEEGDADPGPGFSWYTLCQHSFEVAASASTHIWTDDDCSHGLPPADAVGLGSAENGRGTGGQVSCTPTAGMYQGFGDFTGNTSATLRCLFVDATRLRAAHPDGESPATLCKRTWTEASSGWVATTWSDADCSHGAPIPTAFALAEAGNGAGSQGMASCTADGAQHYNHPTLHGATTHAVSCLYVDAQRLHAALGAAPLTMCQAQVPGDAAGRRGVTWSAADCGGTLPSAQAVWIADSTNGNGTGGQVHCGAASGERVDPKATSGATSGTIRCLYLDTGRAPLVLPDESPPYSKRVDLRGLGGADALLEIDACGTDVCLRVRSEVLPDLAVVLEPAASWVGPLELGTLGRHFEGRLETAYVYYATTSAKWNIAIVDLDAGVVRARARATDAGDNVSTFRLVRGPGDLRYPMMAPAGNPLYPDRTWNTFCLYGGARHGTTACGAGFNTQPTMPPSTGEFFTSLGRTDPATVFNDLFKSGVANLDDVDGDGFDDVNFSWEFTFDTVSGRTGSRLLVTTFDSARDVSPEGHLGFHSGRAFGGTTSIQVPGGDQLLINIAGNAVGDFFYPCAVSRYVAVFKETQAPSRSLWWSDYYGFFPVTSFDLPFSVVNASRFHGCIHRVSDGVIAEGHSRWIMLNWFESSGSIGLCSTCGNAEFDQNVSGDSAYELTTLGLWHHRWIGVDRNQIADEPGAYVWGRSRELLPSGETVLIAERPPNPSPQDFTVAAAPPMQAWRVSWGTTLAPLAFATFPVAGRPKIRHTIPLEGPAGANYSAVGELVTRDVDADGLQDVLLADDHTWIGWDIESSAFVVKAQ